MISAVSGTTGSYSPQAVSGAGRHRTGMHRLADLFDKIDSGGTGSVTKAQFEQAFQTMNPPPGMQALGADAIFNQLDPNGTGSVSKQDFITGMAKLGSQVRAAGRQMAAAGSADASAATADAQGNGRPSFADIVASLKKLEATLGSRSSQAQSGTLGTLLDTSA